jgi:hypothetical protein
LAITTACEGENLIALGQDSVEHPPAQIPPGSVDPDDGGGGPVPNGCQSTDPKHLCLAVKYVVYADAEGAPAITREKAQGNIDEINAVWGQCSLSFQIDRYVSITPAELGLRYQTANYSELTQIRNTFADPTRLLIVTTGPWDRTGSLGTTSANAWTSLPGAGPYGAILEKPVAKFANIIGHELGHYLNLSHVTDVGDLMNAVIYGSSRTLTATQCDTARSAALYFWARMLR